MHNTFGLRGLELNVPIPDYQSMLNILKTMRYIGICIMNTIDN